MSRMLGIALFFIAGSPAMAQAVRSEAGIFACPAIEDEDDRLACFDREIAILAKQAEAGEANVAGDETASATAAEPTLDAAGAAILAEETFGAEDLDKTVSERRAEREERGELSELKAAVIESGENPYGKVFLVLDNGQVWRQLDSDDTMLRIPRGVDATVTIKKSFLGSYMLTVDQLGRTMRAKRIK